MKKILLLTTVILFAWCTVDAQSRRVTGKVTSAEDGSTLPGVNVILKGTATGTTTDADGGYSVDVPQTGGILVFSFIGLSTKEISVGDRTVVDIQLQSDVTQLSEVIVTGLARGTDSRKVPFSVGRVGEDLIQNVPGVNAAYALQGKMAGVSVVAPSGAPGANPVITLRGVSNLRGSQAPLIIIDGIITEGDGNLGDINASDIESMEVVKGAAAASLYGSRAANGVVNIRTKRGADKGQAMSVTVKGEFGQSYLPQQLSLSNSHAYNMNTDGTVNYSSLATDQIADNPYSSYRDHQKDFFNPGKFSTLSVSLGGTSASTRYFASFANTDQAGVIPLLDGFQRQNIKLNIDHDLSKKVTFKTSTAYIQSKNDGAVSNFGPFYSLLFMPPDIDLKARNQEDGSLYDWDVAEPASLERNPLYAIANNTRTTLRNRFLASYAMEFRPVDFLTFEGAYTFDRQNDEFESLYPKGYLSDDVSGVGNGALTYDFDRSFYQTGSFKATYNKKHGDFDVTGQAYYLYENREVKSTDVTGYDFRFKGLVSLNNSFLDDVAGLNRMNAGSSKEKEIAENYYLIGNVVYQDKLIVDAMFRRDRSSLFGADNRANNFYRASLAYRITQDLTIPKVQELKLRASYGVAGIRPPVFNAQYETLSAAGTKQQTGNPLLKSAIQTEYEVGIDANFLSRFNLTVNYANQVSTDAFWERELEAAAGGFVTQWINLDAAITANIIEVTLGSNIFKSGKSSLDANLIFTKINQEVTEFNYRPFQYGPSNTFIYRQGEPFGVMYGEKFARSLSELTSTEQSSGLYTTNSDGYVVRKNEIGTVNEVPIRATAADGSRQFVIGDINPDFNMALNLTYKWKGLSLYALIDWKEGGDVYNQTKQWTFRELRHGDIDQAGVPQAQKKPVNYYAALYNVNAPTDYFVEDGSYVKLRELAANYTIDTRKISFLDFFRSIKVGIVGRNLLVFTNYSGYDPEVGTQGDGQNFMFDGFGYPNFRTLSGSIEFKF